MFFCALLLNKGQIDVPILITFLLYIGSIAGPVHVLLNFMRLYEEGKASFIRFMEMIETKPTVIEKENTGEICSKDRAALWVTTRLPQNLTLLLEMARKAYLGEYKDQWSSLDKEISSLVELMKKTIENLIDDSGEEQ